MPGEFTLGETTLGDTLPAVAGPPPSANLGAGALIGRQNIKARWGERYTSDAVNKKFVGLPVGVYYGFVPSTAGLVVSLRPDVSISYTNISGAAQIGEVITGATSSATANIRVISSGFFLIDTVSGDFVVGETITGTTSSFTADITASSSDGLSFVRVISNTPTVAGRTEHVMDVLTTDTIQIDFTGFIDGTYYVYATGSFAVGSTTIATVQSRTTPIPNMRTEILVCVVTKLSSTGLAIQATAPATRQEPFASTGQRIGFMPGGSIESLLSAISTTQEIVAARESVDGAISPIFDQGFPQSTGLADRLRRDLSRASMASRLGKRLVTTRGNDYAVSAPISAPLNISGSFSARTRTFQPFRDVTNEDLPIGVPVPIALAPNASDRITLSLTSITGSFGVGEILVGADSGASGVIRASTGATVDLDELTGVFQIGEVVGSVGPPLGSGTLASIDNREGAITATDGGGGGDAVRNIVTIVESFTGRKPLDANGNTIYGRLLFGPNGISGIGGGDPGELLVAVGVGEQINFVQGSPTVTNNLVNFTNFFLPGDLIEGADGRFYEIDSTPGSVTSTSLTLTTGKEYLGSSASATSRRRRRFLLKFVSLSAGTETQQTITPGTTIPSGAGLQIVFPSWLNGAQSNYDAHFDVRASGNAYGLAQATIPGVGYNAPGTGGGTGSPVFGSIRTIQSGGMGVGAGNFHTINFTAGSVNSPSPGVISITSAGPTGPPGVGGAGSPGPTGPTGFGLTTIYPYQTTTVPINLFGTPHAGNKVFTFPGPYRFFMVNSALTIAQGELDTGWITGVTASSGATQITVFYDFDGGAGGLGQVMIIGAAAAG